MEALANINPVKPPRVKRKINPYVKHIAGEICIEAPHKVAIQENTLIPVGIAMIIVAAVKYALVSIERPILNI